jgi:hypothetical protein
MGLATISDRVESLGRDGAQAAADGAGAVAREGKRAAKKGVRAAGPWITTGARLGYFAKGLLYLTIGALAFLSAMGSGDGKTLDSKGAIHELHAQWYGTALVAAMTLGLAGHAIWRLVQGALDPEHEIRASKLPWFQRASFLVRGALHVLLVVWCTKLLLGEESSSGDNTHSLIADVMSWHHPLGAILVGVMGAAILAFAIAEVHKAFTEKYAQKLDHRLPRRLEVLVVALARFGTAVRAVLLGVIGAFVVQAAFEKDPSEAQGLGSTLADLHGWSYGWIVLGAAGLGVVAYGAFQVVKARHRRVTPA